MSNEEQKDLMDEFNIYNLIRNLWKDKYQVVIITMIFAVVSIVYSLRVDHLYEVNSVIKPAEASAETSLESSGNLMGFSLGGYTGTPVINQILITLKSNTFLEILYKKYQNEERLFGDGLAELDKTEPDKLLREQKKYDSAIKLLQKVIKFAVNTDHNTIGLSVKLKDKYFAYELMNELLFSLRNYIRKQNVENLQSDIEFYQDLIDRTKDPRVIQMLEKKLSDKIEDKFVLSSNVFTVVNKPFVPSKRIYPKRSFMVVMTTFLGGLFSVLIVSLKPGMKKVYSIIKE
ncbi:MAG: Wzz/FepE/Etk N-terminal domain-containing protein [Candidatus Delongbacteria bacterium]|jgi:LPS O-antigen subunit length determinant protein (WzzB/FepE family)|nr:Wzz/FepE/Etk N-terminal domain-containing protein [Candidatus Delongbacteria bacterium]